MILQEGLEPDDRQETRDWSWKREAVREEVVLEADVGDPSGRDKEELPGVDRKQREQKCEKFAKPAPEQVRGRARQLQADDEAVAKQILALLRAEEEQVRV